MAFPYTHQKALYHGKPATRAANGHLLSLALASWAHRLRHGAWPDTAITVWASVTSAQEHANAVLLREMAMGDARLRVRVLGVEVKLREDHVPDWSDLRGLAGTAYVVTMDED